MKKLFVELSSEFSKITREQQLSHQQRLAAQERFHQSQIKNQKKSIHSFIHSFIQRRTHSPDPFSSHILEFLGIKGRMIIQLRQDEVDSKCNMISHHFLNHQRHLSVPSSVKGYGGGGGSDGGREQGSVGMTTTPQKGDQAVVIVKLLNLRESISETFGRLHEIFSSNHCNPSQTIYQQSSPQISSPSSLSPPPSSSPSTKQLPAQSTFAQNLDLLNQFRVSHSL